MDELQTLRNQIDELDQSLLDILVKRFAVTEQVGRFKAAHHLPLVDSGREAAQAERIAGLARQKGLDPALVQNIQRLIIDAVVERHRQIAQEAGK